MQTSSPEPAASTESSPVEEKKKAETEQVKYSKYDFYSPRKFTKDKMKILSSVFENYIRGTKFLVLSGIMASTNVTISFSLREFTYS